MYKFIKEIEEFLNSQFHMKEKKIIVSLKDFKIVIMMECGKKIHSKNSGLRQKVDLIYCFH